MEEEHKESMMTVRDGVRHIYPVHKNTNKPRTSSKTPTINPCLENVQNINIPIGPYLSKELTHVGKNVKKYIKAKVLCKSKSLPVVVLPESGIGVYGEPEFHSTLRVAKTLGKTRKEQPNVAQLMNDKLNSPNTAARVTKKLAGNVRVDERHKVYRDLVDADVSVGDIVNQMEEQLRIQDKAVFPKIKIPDAAPKISDYFNPNDYVTRVQVTSLNIKPFFSQVQPQKATREQLINFY